MANTCRAIRWWLFAFGVIAIVSPASAQSNYSPPYYFSAFAGAAGDGGAADGPNNTAQFAYIRDIALAPDGTLYVADASNRTIRKISGGSVSLFAGATGVFAFQDGTGSAARFWYPCALAVDPAGNVYVADDQLIRKISPAGVVSTFAGTFSVGGSTDGPRASALFQNPAGLALGPDGTLYVADTENHTIRKIAPDGTVSTIAGLAGSSGSADGTGSAARFQYPTGLALSPTGNLYVADTANHTIRQITPAGVVTTFAGSPGVVGSTDGVGSAAQFLDVDHLVIDAAGNIFVSDRQNATVRRITPGKVVTTIGGLAGIQGSSDGLGAAARYYRTSGLALEASGALYVADEYWTTIRRAFPAPTITAQPISQAATVGGTISLSAGAVGDGISFQWYTDGVAISGAVNSTLSIPNVSFAAAGQYYVVVTNLAGTVQTSSATVTINALPSRLVNLSVRAGTQSGEGTLLVGFVVGGSGTTGTKPLLIRAAGPTLADYGVAGALVDPVLDLISQGGTTPFATNDNWAGNSQVAAMAVAVGAFAFPNTSSKDAALYQTLANGLYSARTTGVGGTSGIALAEIYDASGSAQTSATPRLINISARAPVGTGAGVLIAGFVIEGSSTCRVLIRAVGPTLASYGVGGVLADPKLEVVQTVNGVNVSVPNATNDNWNGDAQVAQAAGSVGAFALSGTTSKDAALFLTLQPGVYSAIASGVGGTSGVALIEIYQVP